MFKTFVSLLSGHASYFAGFGRMSLHFHEEFDVRIVM